MTEASELKVMVVEDYEAMRMLIHRCLTGLGFPNVRLKPNADEALAALRAERFDLIISDYQMAGVDGLQFLKSVRDNPVTRDIQFIMLTGSDDRDIVREAMALGVSEYITKPVEPRNLRDTITRMFGTAHGDAEHCTDRNQRRPAHAVMSSREWN